MAKQTMTAAQLQAKIPSLFAEVKSAGVRLIRAVGGDIGERLMVETPFDVGNARNSWSFWVSDAMVASGNPNTETGGTPMDVGMATANITTLAAPYSYRNNAPYIRRLEWGHSPQRPTGWIRALVADMPNVITTAAERIKPFEGMK